jgi:hypothetical protein
MRGTTRLRTFSGQSSNADVEQVKGLPMTEEDVRRRVDEIDEVADLPEKAHMEEDRLYCDVLQAIAAGADNPAVLRAPRSHVDIRA